MVGNEVINTKTKIIMSTQKAFQVLKNIKSLENEKSELELINSTLDSDSEQHYRNEVRIQVIGEELNRLNSIKLY